MNETTNISGIELEIHTGSRDLHWRDVPYYKFSLNLHPFMLLEEGHTVPNQVKFGKSQERIWCNILYDRDYVRDKITYTLKPLQLSDDKLKAIVDLALGEG